VASASQYKQHLLLSSPGSDKDAVDEQDVCRDRHHGLNDLAVDGELLSSGIRAADAVADLPQTLFVPALISLVLYVFLSFFLIPVYRRYRTRYGQYLPLSHISSQTTTIRQRVQALLVRALLPSSWQNDFNRGRFAINAGDGSDDEFDEDDGEELYEVDESRREALSLDARRGDSDGGRLSRDLEEGFRDDSDDEREHDTRP
jgi:hypothetical protein